MVDTHVRSENSYDATTSVEMLLQQAVDFGFDAVVVTDHDAIAESRRATDLAASYGLVGTPGVEMSTADDHLLALGVDRCSDSARSLAETVASVRRRGGVAGGELAEASLLRMVLTVAALVVTRLVYLKREVLLAGVEHRQSA